MSLGLAECLAPLSIRDWREEGSKGGRVVFAFERKSRRRRDSEDDGEERGGRAASQGTAFYIEDPLRFLHGITSLYRDPHTEVCLNG